MQTVSITVSGKVQGVFFRKYTKEAACKIGITGFVKNTNEGTVYIEATGNESQINEMIQWCHKGSPWSKVNGVKVDGQPLKNFEDFRIQYGE
ncbi:MAG: acylphosphatase [Bacteroidota bacterium]|nr:acylphosphatase [Bacteroidota bacterium]